MSFKFTVFWLQYYYLNDGMRIIFQDIPSLHKAINNYNNRVGLLFEEKENGLLLINELLRFEISFLQVVYTVRYCY